MTFSVRITAASCLLALLASHGSVRADSAEYSGSAANRPWIVNRPWAAFRFATDKDRVEGLPWRVSRSSRDWPEDGMVGSLPWKVPQSATRGSFLESYARPDIRLASGAAPVWTVTADALLLWRSPASSQAVLFAPAFNQADVILLDMADVEFGAQFGSRIGLTRHFANDWSLEVNYFGIDGWSSSVAREGNPLALFPQGILISSRFTVDYGSDLQSAEMKLRRRDFGRLDLLAGLRWVELNEGFHVGGPNPLIGAPDVSYDTLVGNSMFGFQMGANDTLFDRGGRLRIDGVFKAGIFANNAHQETSTRGNLGNLTAVSASRNGVSMLGEAGLTVLYRLGDHLALRCGCQVMWIQDVAMAPDQLPHTDVISTPATATLDANGSVYYYGGQVGLEARW